jgi:hypothetical protein
MVILRTIKLTTALAAFALFFVPWIGIQCSDKNVATNQAEASLKYLGTQTGIQTITGKATPSGEIVNMMRDDAQEPLGFSVLVAAALLATGLGIACLLAALFNDHSKLDVAGCILCVLALMCLLTQFLQGFPAKRELIAKISMDRAINPMGMSDSLGFMMATNIQTVILPGFIATCVLLGIPVLLMVSMFLVKLRAAKQRED